MSGIFKGDSIYKSGSGGGGGYKDGGELIDGDFIKVENNTISSYDNVSRDPVNFYFEVKDGEVLNSVVEFTTQVNATVNVYVVRNGFYYLLGNIGGNTVTAGDDYNINIVGDSYNVEQVNNKNNIPDYVDLGIYGIFPTIKVNNTLWVGGMIKAFEPLDGYETYYLTHETALNVANNIGWRLPTDNEFDELITNFNPNAENKIKSVSGWYNSQNGTNESRLNFRAFGYYQIYGGPIQFGSGQAAAAWTDQAYYIKYLKYDASNFVKTALSNSGQANLRLVKTI